MPPREPRRVEYKWKSFNPAYGPWYRLVKANSDEISGGEAVVQPDMDRSRWFWYVRVGKRNAPRGKWSGHEATLEAAKETARHVFDREY